MKVQIMVLLLLCGLISACDRRSGTSPVSAAAAAAQGQSDYEEHLKRQQAQLEAYDKQAKQAEVQLQAQEDMQKRADALLVSQEQLIKRQQEDFVRCERILDTWERQQKQYQRYLDSLEKPRLTSLTVPSAPSADFFDAGLAHAAVTRSITPSPLPRSGFKAKVEPESSKSLPPFSVLPLTQDRA